MDRAAMDFAREWGIPLCGWCPKGGWAEDYPDPPGLLTDYPELTETPDSDTTQRTKWNMRDCDAILTVVPKGSKDSPGIEVGLDEGEILGKAMFTACGLEDVPEIARWLSSLPDGTELCVGGPRASECENAYEVAKSILDHIASYGLSEPQLYKQLGILTKESDKWKESIPYVSSLLAHESVKIKTKALWLLGEMGLKYPMSVQNIVLEIVSFCDSPVPLLRERAVNALGRIGRGNYQLIEQYWEELFRFATDENPGVRLSFIWASENIAINTPDIYENHMAIYAELLHDPDDKVRMEAPEIFRVIGKRRPEFVKPFEEELRKLSETDNNRVVRIHSLGALKTIETI